MKGGFLGLLMVCLVAALAAVPAWSDEHNQAPVQGTAAPAVPVAAEPAAAAPANASSATSAPVEIKDAVVCQDVVDRAPLGSADVFSKDLAKVYCYCRVLGMEGEGAIVHNWYYQGALKSSIKLPVRAASWRTWSYKAISPEQAGEWMVEIMTESGTALESVVFMIR